MKHCSHVTKLRNLIGQKSCDYSIYPRVVYILEWRHPYSGVSCTEYPPNSEHVFLPEWYVKKLPPPTDWGSSFIFLHTHYIWTVLHDLWTFQTLLGFNLLAHTHFITVTENLFSFFFNLLTDAFHHSLFLSTVFSALMVNCTISSPEYLTLFQSHSEWTPCLSR